MKCRFPIVLVLALASPAAAVVPTLESVFPSGGQKGTEVRIALQGKLEPWPCPLWFSEKGLSFTPDPAKPGTGTLKIAPETPTGPLFIRAHRAEGASPPILFIVGDQTEVLEEEKDNSTLTGAIPLDRSKFPFVLNGTLSAGGELDAFRIPLEKGETLHARVESYGLRAPVDPALHLYDLAGNRLLLEHDGATNLDPSLTFTAPGKADYLLALVGFSHPPAASVAYTGGKNTHYRIHLALQHGHLPNRLRPVDPGPDTGPALVPGKPVIGTLKTPGALATHTITAKKGDSFLLRVEGRGLGFPIDPVLRLLKPDGTEIRKEDDSNKTSDPEYLWAVAADGEYSLTVVDRFGRGGETMRYRLSAAPPVPDFTVTVDKAQYSIERGKPLEIKATLTRLYGQLGELTFTFDGLPDGITLTAPDKVPEKNGEVILKLEAKDGAAPFSGPVRLKIKEVRKEGAALERVAVFSFKDDNHRGPYALDEVRDLWLTLPPVPEVIKEEPKKEEKKP